MPILILVDGSNLIFEGKTPSLLVLESLVAALQIEVSQSSRSDAAIKVYVDAATRRQMQGSEMNRLDAGVREGRYFVSPAGVPADAFILEEASRNNGIVISNDQFKGYESAHPWITAVRTGRMFAAVRSSGSWIFMEKKAGQDPPRLLQEILRSTLKASDNGTSPSPKSPGDEVGGSHLTAYERRLSRANPGLMVFLLDQSGSMTGHWAGSSAKHIEAARILNRAIREVVLNSTRPEGVRDYVEFAVLGYSGGYQGGVKSLLPGTSLDKPILSTSRVNEAARIEQSILPSGRKAKQPVWIDPVASGTTPMCAALEHANTAVSEWVVRYPHSFPPVVINLSDGESSDGSPVSTAKSIASKGTKFGMPLVFNVCIASEGEFSTSLRYPASIPPTAGQYMRNMFEASSVVPTQLRRVAKSKEISIPEGGRGFVFNATVDDVVRMLDFGTPVFGELH